MPCLHRLLFGLAALTLSTFGCATRTSNLTSSDGGALEVAAARQLAVDEEKAGVDPLRVLLVTGGCCHDYDTQKVLIPEAIEKRIRVEWTVVHEGGTGRDHKMSVFQTADWADKFDVVVHNTCFGGMKDEDFMKSIVDGHRKNGVGAVILHCGLHSYRNLESKAWHEFLGVSSMRHDPGAPVPVQNARPSHPIMMDFPDRWTTPKDELYAVARTWPDLEVLGLAYSKKSKLHHPVIWTYLSGKARVFGASIGHSNETMNHPAYLEMVTRAILWTASVLEDDGQPSPGYRR